jgi:hypothetical protein
VAEPAKPLPESPRDVPNPIQQLTKLHATLTIFLDAIDDDPQILDASSKKGHDLVEEIRKIVKGSVFSANGLLKASDFKELHAAYKASREAEYDQHNIYSETLERYKKRRGSLSVAEVDEDTQTLVARRRKYIPKLTEFNSYVKAIIEECGKSPST